MSETADATGFMNVICRGKSLSIFYCMDFYCVGNGLQLLYTISC